MGDIMGGIIGGMMRLQPVFKTLLPLHEFHIGFPESEKPYNSNYLLF